MMDNERCLMVLTRLSELFTFDPTTGYVYGIDTEGENNQELLSAIEYAMRVLVESTILNVKLDAVRTECKMRQYGLMESEFDYGLAQMADEIMAIIGNDGDKK